MIIRGNTVGHALADPRKGMTMEGGIDMNGQVLTGIGKPKNDSDAVSYGYVKTMINESLEVIENGTY